MRVKIIETTLSLPLGAQALGEVVERRMNDWIAANPTAQIRQVIAAPISVGGVDPHSGNLIGMIGSLTYIFYD